MTAQAQPIEQKQEKSPKQSWRYFWSIIKFSPWMYAGIVLLRLFIFGVFPQLTGLVMRDFFNTLV